jgi:hypothetical protein
VYFRELPPEALRLPSSRPAGLGEELVPSFIFYYYYFLSLLFQTIFNGIGFVYFLFSIAWLSLVNESPCLYQKSKRKPDQARKQIALFI